MAFVFTKNQVKSICLEVRAGFNATGLGNSVTDDEITALAPSVVIGVVLALTATLQSDVVFIADQQFVFSRRKLLACARAAIDGGFFNSLAFLSEDGSTGKTAHQIRRDLVLFCRRVHLDKRHKKGRKV